MDAQDDSGTESEGERYHRDGEMSDEEDDEEYSSEEEATEGTNRFKYAYSEEGRK